MPGAPLKINIGKQGDDATVTLAKVDYDALMLLNNSQAVTTRMIGMKYTDTRTQAIFGAYHRGDSKILHDCASIVASNTLVHWPYPIDADVPETSSRVYARSLTDAPNLTPMTRRWEVLSESLERRVTMVANHKMPTKYIQGLAIEFVEQVVPHQSIGVPLTVEEAAKLLDKPTQVLAVKNIGTPST